MIKMSSIDVKDKIRLDIKEFEEVIVINEDTSASSLVQELREMASQQRQKPPLTRGMTLTLLTLSNVNDTIDEVKDESTNISNGGAHIIGGSQNPLVNQNHHDSQQSKLPISISLTDRIKLWFKARPIFNLICIIIFNGLLSAACSALVIRIEKPSQDIRLAQRTELLSKLEKMKINITSRLSNPVPGTLRVDTEDDLTIAMIKDYSNTISQLKNHPEEIGWDMLSAQAFFTAIQSTTGYGDIVPVTPEGKLLTIVYGLFGIPIFFWYISKLGNLFRGLIMNMFSLVKLCFGQGNFEKQGRISTSSRETSRFQQRRSTLEAFVYNTKTIFKQQFKYDERFHPIVIGTILLIFLLVVSLIISRVEEMTYFDSFYACFITYSMVGFGDKDIFRVSYRSSWYDTIVYGYFIHILGYVVVMAWVAAILDKYGVKKL